MELKSVHWIQKYLFHGSLSWTLHNTPDLWFSCLIVSSSSKKAANVTSISLYSLPTALQGEAAPEINEKSALLENFSVCFFVYLWLRKNCHPTVRHRLRWQSGPPPPAIPTLRWLYRDWPLWWWTCSDCTGLQHQVTVQLAVSSTVQLHHHQPDHVCLPKLRANVFLAAGAGAVSGLTCSAQSGVQNRSVFFSSDPTSLDNTVLIFQSLWPSRLVYSLCIHWTGWFFNLCPISRFRSECQVQIFFY